MSTPGRFEALEGFEWLEANGLGGYASSTFSGANSRRYHGVLVAALQPPMGRFVMLSKLDESLRSGDQRFELADNRFPGTSPGNSAAHLASYSRELFPVSEYQCGSLRLRKTVAALDGENSTLICYELLQGQGPVTLELQPFLAPRDYHSLAQANPGLRWDKRFEDGLLRLEPYEGLPPLYVSVPGARFVDDPHWYYRFQYRREEERGLGFEEDLFTYGRFEVPLEPGKPLYVIASMADPSGREGQRLLAAEGARRQALLAAHALHGPLLRRLALAADQFVVRRGQGLNTVIAGYPWFADWGRDTMIAFRGLCLSSGRLREAKGILEAFLQALDQGMLPNRFPDGGEAPEYNTVDATLWLFVAVHAYWKRTWDNSFVLERCLPALLDALAWHRRGTRYGIQVAQDGLLSAGEPGVQLTWMDAKVGDWVVTPRRGKAVEVNALWYNALRICAELAQAKGQLAQARDLVEEAGRVKAAFESAFWKPDDSGCYDVLGPEGSDASLRPNQIFALSLPFPLLGLAKALQVLKLVGDELLTPRGLRSLSPQDPRYQARYAGGVDQRDGAYHQGTVWAWLLGPYMEALIRFKGAPGKAEAKLILDGMAPHLDEAGVGSVSEIFDGAEPHWPRGCYAQAWSVAELLRVGVDLL